MKKRLLSILAMLTFVIVLSSVSYGMGDGSPGEATKIEAQKFVHENSVCVNFVIVKTVQDYDVGAALTTYNIDKINTPAWLPKILPATRSEEGFYRQVNKTIYLPARSSSVKKSLKFKDTHRRMLGL